MQRAWNWIKTHPIAAVLGSLLAIVLIVAAVLWLKPVSLPAEPAERNALGYDQAVELINEFIAGEQARSDIRPECETQALLHDERPEKVIVFYHGFTSCPAQFAALGQRFYNEGYNVLIPRLPRHGNSNRLTDELSELTTEELLTFTNTTLDIAGAFGDEVTLAGLSAGGTLAMWAAQHRSDLDRVVIMAPLIGAGVVPAALTRPVTNLALLMPSRYMWWDGEGKDASPRIVYYSYPGYETRGMGQMLRIGLAILQEARSSTPNSKNILIITNGNDQAVNRDEIRKIVAEWQNNPDTAVETYEFDAATGLPHDFVTVEHPAAQIDLVYPILIDLIEGRTN